MTDMCRLWILFLVRVALTWPRLVKMSRCMNIYTADGNKIPFLPQSWKWKTTANEKKLLSEGGIFHFDDHGRKGRPSRVL